MRKPRQILNYGPRALLLQWAQEISPAVNDSVHAYARACLNIEGVAECVPAYCTLLVTFHEGKTNSYRLREHIYSLSIKAKRQTGKLHKLPVCYGGEFGPDLKEIAEKLRLTTRKIIQLHQATTYRVYQLGYRPGFAFLGLTDSKLEIGRRDSPRAKVPAGSVGLAGRQTGIYPSESPGGWQIIGRCPWPMIDTNVKPFSRLQAGDSVEFFAIKPKEWDKYQNKPELWTS
ncbi:MAG: 5-oxoprolinase subunit PxpB [Bacteroidota bacterium]